MEAHEEVMGLKVDLMNLNLLNLNLYNGVTFGKALDAMCTLSAIGLLSDTPTTLEGSPALSVSERRSAIETISKLAENAMKDRISSYLDPNA